MLQVLFTIVAVLCAFNFVKAIVKYLSTQDCTVFIMFPFAAASITLSVLSAVNLGTMAFVMGIIFAAFYGLIAMSNLFQLKLFRFLAHTALMTLFIVGVCTM